MSISESSSQFICIQLIYRASLRFTATSKHLVLAYFEPKKYMYFNASIDIFLTFINVTR